MTQNSRATRISPQNLGRKHETSPSQLRNGCHPKSLTQRFDWVRSPNKAKCPLSLGLIFEALTSWNVDEISNFVFETITDSLGSYPYLG